MIRILSWIPGVYPTSINKLPLPNSYIQLERMGRWRVPAFDLLETVFGEACTDPCSYGREELSREDTNLVEQAADDDYFVGQPDPEFTPGNIRPRKLVLIGDLGADRPIALDYRDSFETPSVIYLRWTENGSRWVAVAESFASLAKMLGL